MARRRSDVDYLHDMLVAAGDGWLSNADILRRSIQERGCGMTVHSRIAELRKRIRRALDLPDHVNPILQRHDPTRDRGDAHQYHLVYALPKPEASPSGVSGSGSASVGDMAVTSSASAKPGELVRPRSTYPSRLAEPEPSTTSGSASCDTEQLELIVDEAA